MSHYLSKSDFKVARTCATKLYYTKLGYPSTKDDDPYLQFLAEGAYMLEAMRDREDQRTLTSWNSRVRDLGTSI